MKDNYYIHNIKKNKKLQADHEKYQMHIKNGKLKQKQIEKTNLNNHRKKFINEYPDFGEALLKKYTDVGYAELVAKSKYIGLYKCFEEYIDECVEKNKRNPKSKTYKIDFEVRNPNRAILLFYIHEYVKNTNIPKFFTIAAWHLFGINDKDGDMHIFREF